MKPEDVLTFRVDVLGYHEDDEFVALALQLDLRGYGATFEEAMADLNDSVRMQISFALERNQSELIWRDAEPRWFDLFNRARNERLHSLFNPKRQNLDDYIAADIPIPTPHAIKSLNTRFSQNG